jgi:hypothetical protein
MKPVLFVVYSVFIALACNNSPAESEEKSVAASDSNISMPDSLVTSSHVDSVPMNIQIDSVIHLAFPKDSVSVTVKGHLDKKGDPVICILPVASGRKLTALITPEKKNATIRFSHIKFPDGKSDGPFSNSLKYDLAHKGTYKLYIGPNMMAGDPVSSDFVLNVKVE